jgi:hypothetical protein
MPTLKGLRSKEVSPKITAQMRTIYVSAPTAGAAESADSP